MHENMAALFRGHNFGSFIFPLQNCTTRNKGKGLLKSKRTTPKSTKFSWYKQPSFSILLVIFICIMASSLERDNKSGRIEDGELLEPGLFVVKKNGL